MLDPGLTPLDPGLTVPAAEYQVPEDEYLVPAGEYRWSMHMTAGPGRPVRGSRSHWRLRRKKKIIAR